MFFILNQIEHKELERLLKARASKYLGPFITLFKVLPSTKLNCGVNIFQNKKKVENLFLGLLLNLVLQEMKLEKKGKKQRLCVMLFGQGEGGGKAEGQLELRAPNKQANSQ